MSDTTFSIADHFAGAERFFQEQVEPFAAKTGLEVTAKAVPWDKLWSYLQDVMSGEARQDVSEVGSTWVGHFIEKGGICQLSADDIDTLGGTESFFPATWESCRLINHETFFAVPWLADTRVVYYWRDHLKSAGVDETAAFSTPNLMTQTLDRLAERGRSAFAAPTFEVNNTLHLIASWIWSNGGDFLDDSGKRTLFCEPEAMKGIIDYFCLFRFMPGEFNSLNAVLDRFEDQRISVIIDGPWFLMRMILGGAPDETLANLGVALPPGPPFVGGSNLVVWKRDDVSERVFELIQHLTSTDVLRNVCKITGLLPARPQLLREAPYATDPHYQVFNQALQLGRPTPSIAFWGPLEEALRRGFGAIWRDVKATKNCGMLETIVSDNLTPIAKRFDRLLKLVQFEL